MRNLGMGELLVILVVIMLLFGAKKLPELARSLGKSLNEFKKGRDEHIEPNKTPETTTSTLSQKDVPRQPVTGMTDDELERTCKALLSEIDRRKKVS